MANFGLLRYAETTRLILDNFDWVCIVCTYILHGIASQSAMVINSSDTASSYIYSEGTIMSLKPAQKLELDEIKFFGELGWFATLSVAVATLALFFKGMLG